MQGKTVLSVHRLSKSFPGVKALDGVDMEINQGEVHALLGENGAGKSTLVKIIAGVYQKDEGVVHFNNIKRNFSSPLEAYESGISVIHQETSLIPQLTVFENIFLGIEYTKTFLGIIDNERLLKEYREISETLDFHFPIHKQARDLSMAEQKMVEILKAMVHKASFLIMDEPTDALTEREIKHLFRIISDLKKKNITVLYITHYLDEVFEIADRLTVLRDGGKINTVETKETSKDEVIVMMVGHRITKDTDSTTMTTTDQEAIRVENMTRRGSVQEVSFKAYKGEILGITGLIGSGKTELARLIFGADRPDSGRIFIDNRPVNIKSPHNAVKNGIGMMPEDRKKFGLLLNHEVYKNITLSSISQFIRGGVLLLHSELRATKVMTKKLTLKISGPYQYVRNLSGGNQQKVVVEKWLTANPKVLIMDEPTRGIDVNAKAEIFRIIKILANEGTCIIFISSEVPEIVEVCDRILILKKGTISAEFRRGVTQGEIMQNILEGSS